MVEELYIIDQNTRQKNKGGCLWICGQAEYQGLLQKQHRTEHKGHTFNPRIGIQIPGPAGSRNQTSELELRDSAKKDDNKNLIFFRKQNANKIPTFK